MSTLIKYFSTTVILILFLSCGYGNDPLIEEEEPDYTEFLADDNVRISCMFNNQPMDWVYGEGYGKSFGGCIWKEDGKVFNKSGMSESNGGQSGDRFRLYTPDYYLNVESDVDAVFNPGMKSFGELYEGFYFKIQVDGVEYESSHVIQPMELQVLKRSDMIPFGDTEYFIAWFQVDKINLNSIENPTVTAELKNVLMALQFQFFTE